MRTLSRKDFLRLGGVGLAGASLLGAAGCSGRLGANKKIVKLQLRFRWLLSSLLHHTRTRHDAHAREVMEIEGASHGFAVPHPDEVA